jgi:hypothetical protein
MLLVANGWDGIWAALAGGVLSGLTVVIGVYLAQWLSDRRKRSESQRAAADQLLLEVTNVRDAAVHSRSKSRSGTYDLWPLRHQIYVSNALRGRQVLEAVQNYYDAVWDLREWIRRGPIAQGDRRPTREDDKALADFQRAIDDWAQRLIDALQTLAEHIDELTMHGPQRPELPD